MDTPGTTIDVIEARVDTFGTGDTAACGDGLCLGGETTLSCPADCGDPPATCGDGVCLDGETNVTCPQDCGEAPPPGPTCGDGICNDDETTANCAQDCAEPPTATCGDGICNGTEDTSNCPTDCGKTPPITGPNLDIKGWVDSVTNDGSGLTVNGWTCQLGLSASIEVHIYVDGPINAGTFLKASTANADNEQAVNDACQAAGTHRYHIPLTSEEITKHAGKSIHAYGVSAAGSNALGNSGKFQVPGTTSVCGDGVCAEWESGASCPADCGDAPPPDVPAGSVGKWRRKVLKFTTNNYSGNPFLVEINATFTHTASGKKLTLPGYYDGNNTWKIGFMPTKVGDWTYKTSSPNGALSGQTGTVNAVASGHKGLLARDKSHPDKWRFSDGPYAVPIGVFVNAMLEEASAPTFSAMADFVRDNNMHLLNFRISEHDKAFDNIGGQTMHLGRWKRLENRMEILTERGLGVDIMLYTDDAGKPSFGPKSPQEKLLIRYTVARLCGFPSVFFNSGIDLIEYRDQAWVNWYGNKVKSLDPYGHPVSSRYGAGSGNLKMTGQTYNSKGGRNSKMIDIQAAYAPGDGVPAANNDNWSEDLPGNINGHTPADIRRALWKATVAGGMAMHIRHNTLFCPAGITECDRYFHIASLHEELNSEQWLAHVAPFIEQHLGTTFGSMEPSPGLVGGGGGKYALADPARNRILYFLLGQGDTWDNSDGGPATAKLGGVNGTFEGIRINPRTGNVTPAGTFTGGTNHTLTPPNTHDWVFVLKRT